MRMTDCYYYIIFYYNLYNTVVAKEDSLKDKELDLLRKHRRFWNEKIGLIVKNCHWSDLKCMRNLLVVDPFSLYSENDFYLKYE